MEVDLVWPIIHLISSRLASRADPGEVHALHDDSLASIDPDPSPLVQRAGISKPVCSGFRPSPQSGPERRNAARVGPGGSADRPAVREDGLQSSEATRNHSQRSLVFGSTVQKITHLLQLVTFIH